jgi:hypothetical protein
MKLHECTLGVVVRYTMLGFTDNYSYIKIGHIVGFEYNPQHEVIPMVKWADGSIRGIHHANLALLTETNSSVTNGGCDES